MRVAGMARWMAVVGIGVGALAVSAKEKKPVMPTYILTARTVAVVVDPMAGMSLTNPNANPTAQRDVEMALKEWGRFDEVMEVRDADLIIVVRKGTGKLVDETMANPQNNRTNAGNRMPGGAGAGAGMGNAEDASQSAPPGGMRPQAEIGEADDSFTVYQGQMEHPLDGPIGWRWIRKDGLRPHDVPAVDEFRKAIEDAEKKAAAAAAKHP